MAQRLTTEWITAAINGFQEQKKRIDSQIAELRQMLKPNITAGSATIPTKKRRFSAAARKRMAAAQRERWAETGHRVEALVKALLLTSAR